MRLEPTEGEISRACLDLLAAERIWFRRWNSGAVQTGKRFFRFGKAGDADIVAIPNNPLIILWIETKTRTGKQSPAQKQFQQEVEAEGHTYLLVRDVQTLIDFLEEMKCKQKIL